MILILIEQNYQLFKERKTENDFKYLSSYQVMRAVIRDTPGGKDQEKADYIKEKYKDNDLMKRIIGLGICFRSCHKLKYKALEKNYFLAT